MTIQFNTDKTINGDEKNQNHYITLIRKRLIKYQSHISRIEVHLADENGNKKGYNDICCLMEARIEGVQPIAVSNQADTVEQAVSGAIHKLKASLDKTFENIKRHH